VKEATGIDPCEPLGAAQGCQRLREPGTGHGLAPVDIRVPPGVVLGDASPSQHTHRLAERKAVGSGTTFDRLKSIEGPAQTFMVDFDPLAAYQDQPVGVYQEPLDFGRRKFFTVERHIHLEVEQRIHPHL